MRTEISQAKKEANFYLQNVEKGKAIDAMETRKRKRADQVRLCTVPPIHSDNQVKTHTCKDNCTTYPTDISTCFTLSSLSRGKMNPSTYSSQTNSECTISPELLLGNLKQI